MDTPINRTYQKQNAKLIPSSIKKAIISAVNISQRQCDIFFPNNPQTIVKGVSVSNSVDMTTLIAGQRVKIDIFDETNPKDIVIAYAYGGGPSNLNAVGKTVVITYVSNVVLNNLGGGTYTLTKTTGTLTFTNGILTAST